MRLFPFRGGGCNFQIYFNFLIWPSMADLFTTPQRCFTENPKRFSKVLTVSESSDPVRGEPIPPTGIVNRDSTKRIDFMYYLIKRAVESKVNL